MQGGTGGRKSPRDGGGGGRGARGRIRDGGVAKCGKAGAARVMTEATEATEIAASERKRATEDLSVGTHKDGAGGKYHVGRTGPKESADENA